MIEKSIYRHRKYGFLVKGSVIPNADNQELGFTTIDDEVFDIAPLNEFELVDTTMKNTLQVTDYYSFIQKKRTMKKIILCPTCSKPIISTDEPNGCPTCGDQ